MSKYLVSLYRGYGYTLDSIEVEAYDIHEALEIAVASGLGWAVEEGSEDFNELHYMDEDSDDAESWYYIDLSEYDKPNVYVYLENARIDEVV